MGVERIGSDEINAGIESEVQRRPAELVIRRAENLVSLELRARIFCKEQDEFIGDAVELTDATVHIPLRGVKNLSKASLVVEKRTGSGWQAATPKRSLAESQSAEVHGIRPADWGVTSECLALIRTKHGKVVHKFAIPPGGRADIVIEFLDDSMVHLRFYAITEGRRGDPLSTLSRVVSHDYNGAAERIAIQRFHNTSLSVSTRRNVTLSPTRSPSWMARNRFGLFSYLGYAGAWSGGDPIPEVLEFTLGRQQHLFQSAPQVAEKKLPSPIIYLGPTHTSWGHFLTQGLARIWYALENPEVPILWDGPRLPPYGQEVLTEIGVKNEAHFLDSCAHADEVIFPEPGIGLGDYVSKEFAERVGVVAVAEKVEGRKLFLHREITSSDRAGLSGGRDLELVKLMARYGFESYSPEEHSVSEQLRMLSSAEVVAGIEGSAFHTLLLLQKGCRTRFREFTRHRGGGGVFEHIKIAKDLNYETLNFLAGKRGNARSATDIDLDRLDEYLAKSEGLRFDLDGENDLRERPTPNQARYSTLLATSQIALTREQEALRDVASVLPEAQAQQLWNMLSPLG